MYTYISSCLSRYGFITLSLHLLSVSLLAQNLEDRYVDRVSYFTFQDGIKVAYTDSQEGEQTLVFIHGLGNYIPVWQKLQDSLKSSYRCVALDLPGHGLSGKDKYAYSIRFYADCVDALLSHLKLDQVIFVGHSLGGQVAMRSALDHPDRVSALVLLAPSGLETFTASQASLVGNFFNTGQIERTSDAKIRTDIENTFYKMPEDAQFLIEDRIRFKSKADFSGYAHAIAESVKAMLADPMQAELPNIKVPTLLIFGKEDKLIPNPYFNPSLKTETLAQEAASHLPQGELHLMEETGHLLIWEKAEDVKALMLNFFKK